MRLEGIEVVLCESVGEDECLQSNERRVQKKRDALMSRA